MGLAQVTEDEDSTSGAFGQLGESSQGMCADRFEGVEDNEAGVKVGDGVFQSVEVPGKGEGTVLKCAGVEVEALGSIEEEEVRGCHYILGFSTPVFRENLFRLLGLHEMCSFAGDSIAYGAAEFQPDEQASRRFH